MAIDFEQLAKDLATATPGPWLRDKRTIYTLRSVRVMNRIKDENAWTASIHPDGRHETPGATLNAIAALMAAAPNLARIVLLVPEIREALESCADAIEDLGGCSDPDCEEPNCRHGHIKAVAALAKLNEALK